jgi:hypothetical protein
MLGRQPTTSRTPKAFNPTLKTIKLQETYILVSFNMLSLFTNIPLEDTLQMLSQHFHSQTISLFRQVLTTTYVLYDGAFTIKYVLPWDHPSFW